MRVLVAGSSGLVGTALVRRLRGDGDEVVRLVRNVRPGDSDYVAWDPGAGDLDREAISGFDAVVHLGGENIQALRWTASKKRRIRDSRVNSTKLLAESLARVEDRAPVFVCASAIGFYGDRGADEMDELAAPGTGFMAETCQAWEAATEPAREAGIRVVNLRIGLVLSREGGVLPILRTVFRAGLGGPLAGGGMYVSWIELEDLVSAIQLCLKDCLLEGPVNGVSPHPVTNRELTRALSKALHRPAILPAPAWGIRLALGEMGEELLLSSTRVKPGTLMARDFTFAYPHIEGALQHNLEGISKPAP